MNTLIDAAFLDQLPPPAPLPEDDARHPNHEDHLDDALRVFESPFVEPVEPDALFKQTESKIAAFLQKAKLDIGLLKECNLAVAANKRKREDNDATIQQLKHEAAIARDVAQQLAAIDLRLADDLKTIPVDYRNTPMEPILVEAFQGIAKKKRDELPLLHRQEHEILPLLEQMTSSTFIDPTPPSLDAFFSLAAYVAAL